MIILVQVLVACVIGVTAWFMSELIGIADPWPIVIGVIAALLCLGFSVIVVDADMF